ncbi:MAG TPA: PH domain-containing protein [Candidatus Dormibacteraeota bacterium]|nr:PH domain-containing protein [Candidatus Dormibacteraeota bacterium]
MDPVIQAELQPELQPDEHLMWTGRPDPGSLFTAMDAFLVPFSLLWGGFAIFWESSVIAAGAPVFFLLWGTPFVLLGLYLIFGRFLVKRYTRRHTYYGVTDRRVIVLSTAFGRNVKSVSIKRLPGLELSTRRGRAGTVTFGHWSGFAGMYANTGLDWLAWGMGQRPMAFYDLEDARSVYELVDRLAA